MAAYLLGNFKVTNAEEFEKYRDLVTKTIRDHGGEYVLVDMNSVAVEGHSEHLSVVLKFPSVVLNRPAGHVAQPLKKSG